MVLIQSMLDAVSVHSKCHNSKPEIPIKLLWFGWKLSFQGSLCQTFVWKSAVKWTIALNVMGSIMSQKAMTYALKWLTSNALAFERNPLQMIFHFKSTRHLYQMYCNELYCSFKCAAILKWCSEIIVRYIWITLKWLLIQFVFNEQKPNEWRRSIWFWMCSLWSLWLQTHSLTFWLWFEY